MRYFLPVLPIWLSLFISACAQDSPAAKLENVNFSQVLALDYRDSDHRLSYGPDALQFGELWLPVPATAGSPLVVLLHGGCWLNEFGIDHVYPLSSALADAGYAVFALEYRRVGDAGGGWPGSFEDIRAGLRYTARLDALGVDTGQMALVGHSAGGHLALLAGTDLAETGRPAKLVVGLAAITNLTAYAGGDNNCQTATSLFMGGGPEQNPALYASANPARQTIAPATWLLHGQSDTIVPVSQAQLAGARVQLLAGAGHFDWVHPGTSAFQRLLTLLQEEL